MKYLKIRKDCIEEGLQKYIGDEPSYLKKLHEAMIYSLFPGGKRIRPLFCYLSGELFGIDENKLLSMACAVEMMHAASLILDDLPLMDDSPERRGKPSTHMVYGENVACLASMGLIMKSYEIIACDPYLADREKSAVISRLAKAAGIIGMVGGQYVDLTCPLDKINHIMMDYIHTHKTSSLFMAAGSVAAIAANASDQEIQAIETYALNLGYAFQIQDDILDYRADAIPTASHEDGAVDFVRLYGMDRAREMLVETTQKALDSIAMFGDKNAKLKHLAGLLMRRSS